MRALLLTLLFWPLCLQAQFHVSAHALVAYNKYANEFLLLDDSTHYQTYNLTSKKWTKHALTLALDQPFDSLKREVQLLAISKEEYYVVANGCGLVYALKNGVLRRIDQSFAHNNQFSALTYEYKQRLYFFGGYGLFETKNTHTRFLPSDGGWFQVSRHTQRCPSPRMQMLGLRTKHFLHVLGGKKQDLYQDHQLTDYWVFDCYHKTWRMKGRLNPDLVKRMSESTVLPNIPQPYFFHDNKLIRLDVDKNRYFVYESPLFVNLKTFLPDQTQALALMTNQLVGTDSLKLEVQPFANLIELSPTSYYLYKKNSFLAGISNRTWLVLSVLANLILFMLLFYIRRMHKTNWYKARFPQLKREEFTDTEWQVLLLIQRSGELELSALNDLFDEEGLSYETLKKRRESFMRALRTKIALLTRRNIDDLLVEKRHPLDKRMKLITWNKDLEIK